MRFRFIQNEGYYVSVQDNDTSLDNCSVCGVDIGDEVFFLCEKHKTAICFNCRLKAPCQRKPVSVIPSYTGIKELCSHRRIIGKKHGIQKG